MKLSVAIATFNEEENIARCLEAIKDIADEIIVVDGTSTDDTVKIASSIGRSAFGRKKSKFKIIVTDNPPIFHINKQKAINACQGDWILQLDADEVISEKLAKEIRKVISLSNEEIEAYQETLANRKLFLRHQKILIKRDGKIGNEKGEYAGFFVPRLNYFLGKYLRCGGVYPDGVIRLVKNGKAHFSCQSVHDQIIIDGRVGWLRNDLIHLADVSFKKYLYRNNKYINLMVTELKEKNIGKNLPQFLNYFLIKPSWWFFWTLFRHKGILDGYQGIVFSFFSALRFPRAYWRYIVKN